MSMFKVYDNLKIMSILLLFYRAGRFSGRIYRKSSEIGIKAASGTFWNASGTVWNTSGTLWNGLETL